jgi:hypothetical protein
LYGRGWPDCCYVIRQESTKRFSERKTRRFVWTLVETSDKRPLITSRQVQEENFQMLIVGYVSKGNWHGQWVRTE